MFLGDVVILNGALIAEPHSFRNLHNRPTRRSLMGTFAAGLLLLAMPAIGRGQALTPVRLLVVRKPGFSLTNACLAPCIRGKIYDVSDLAAFDISTVTLPLLGSPICDCIERPWKDNQPFKSSIPAGMYPATVRRDARKEWMDTIDKRWRIELQRTDPRANIQFHYGKDVKWSEGCFIVGDLLQPDGSSGMQAGYCSVSGGEAAVARLRAVVEGPGRNRHDIVVGVTDDFGVFPDFGGAPPC